MNGRGGDSGITERRVELGIGLRVRFHQGMDLLNQFGMVVFSLVPSAGGEVVETADAGAKFAESGRHGIATPAKNPFGATRVSVAVLEGHFGLEPAASKAGELAGGGENDFRHDRRQAAVHDRILIREGAPSREAAAAM